MDVVYFGSMDGTRAKTGAIMESARGVSVSNSQTSWSRAFKASTTELSRLISVLENLYKAIITCFWGNVVVGASTCNVSIHEALYLCTFPQLNVVSCVSFLLVGTQLMLLRREAFPRRGGDAFCGL